MHEPTAPDPRQAILDELERMAFQDPDRQEDWLAEVAQRFNGHPEQDALVAKFRAALGAMRALQELNRRVPEDCSIVGLAFGQEAELFVPALTAVEWSGYEIGRRAARMLVDELRGDSTSPRQVLIPPKLQVRRSAAPVGALSPG